MAKFRSPRLSLLAAFCALLGLAACNITSAIKPPKWEAEILGPIAKAELAPQDVLQISQFKFSYSFGYTQINSAVGNVLPASGGNFIVPPLGPVSVGFYDTVPTPQLRSLTLESGSLGLTIQNQFPFAISAGTTILVRNAGASTALVSYALPEDLPANSTHTANLDISNVTIGVNLQFQLANFRTPGSGVQFVNLNPNSLIQVQFSIHNYVVRQVVVNQNQQLDLADTAQYTLSGDVVNTDVLSGNFVLHVESQVPIAFTSQGYFLAADKQTVVDSLFDQPFTIKAAQTDGSGNVVITSYERDTLPVNEARLNLLKQAKYFAVRSRASTYGTQPTVTITRSQSIRVQIVGDLKTKINQSSSN